MLGNPTRSAAGCARGRPVCRRSRVDGPAQHLYLVFILYQTEAGQGRGDIAHRHVGLEEQLPYDFVMPGVPVQRREHG